MDTLACGKSMEREQFLHPDTLAAYILASPSLQPRALEVSVNLREQTKQAAGVAVDCLLADLEEAGKRAVVAKGEGTNVFK